VDPSGLGAARGRVVLSSRISGPLWTTVGSWGVEAVLAADTPTEIHTMDTPQKLVIVISRGLDDERASVAWSIANTAVASGFDLTVFLVSAGVDWVRKGAARVAQLNPLDPSMGEMVAAVMAGGSVLACPPCAKVRGYAPDDLLEGVVLAGAPAMLERVQQGASTLSF